VSALPRMHINSGAWHLLSKHQFRPGERRTMGKGGHPDARPPASSGGQRVRFSTSHLVPWSGKAALTCPCDSPPSLIFRTALQTALSLDSEDVQVQTRAGQINLSKALGSASLSFPIVKRQTLYREYRYCSHYC
jgi:hypothetical protein